MQLTTAILVIFGLFTFALAADDGLGPRHPVVPFQYSGTLGGHEVQFNGTVQEIYAQMQELYPDFKPEHALVDRSEPVNLPARGVDSKSNLLCCPIAGQDWGWAQSSRIVEGANYLKGLDICGVPANSCVRISCSWSSGIYLCNDNAWGITPKCDYIASYAMDILGQCHRKDTFNPSTTCGQEFDTDGYNVVVHNDRC